MPIEKAIAQAMAAGTLAVSGGGVVSGKTPANRSADYYARLRKGFTRKTKSELVDLALNERKMCDSAADKLKAECEKSKRTHEQLIEARAEINRLKSEARIDQRAVAMANEETRKANGELNVTQIAKVAQQDEIRVQAERIDKLIRQRDEARSDLARIEWLVDHIRD